MNMKGSARDRFGMAVLTFCCVSTLGVFGYISYLRYVEKKHLPKIALDSPKDLLRRRDQELTGFKRD
jgi:hypothetical protein